MTDEYNLLCRNHGKLSKIHKQISNFLIENNIKHQNEVRINIQVNNNLKSPIVDILISGKNKIIEIYGDRWHLNPLKYKPNDIITHLWLNKRYGELKAKDVWKKDNERIKSLKNLGYDILILWENDIKNNFENVQTNILNFIKE